MIDSVVVERDSIRDWQCRLSDRPGLHLDMQLRTVLGAPVELPSFSLKALEYALAEGFSIEVLPSEPPGNETSEEVVAPQYAIRCRAAYLAGQVVKDSETGIDLLQVNTFSWSAEGLNPVAKQNLIAVPLRFSPVMILHLSPWTDMPAGTDLTELLRSGASIIRVQDWIVDGEGDFLTLQTWNYHIELISLPNAAGREKNFMVRRVRALHEPKLPDTVLGPTTMFLDASCFRLEQALPLVVPVELLDNKALARFEPARPPKAKNTKPNDPGAKPATRKMPFRVTDFGLARNTRRPLRIEIEDLSFPSHILEGVIPENLGQQGLVALDYPRSRFNLTIICGLTTSKITGRPYLAAFRIQTPDYQAVREKAPPRREIAANALVPVCGVSLQLSPAVIARSLAEGSEIPTREEIFADLAKGFSLVPFAETRDDHGAVKLLSQRFRLVVKPSLPTREPKAGTQTRSVTSVLRRNGQSNRGVAASVWPVELLSCVNPADLVSEGTVERADQILSSHYLFASTYSQLIAYRDIGVSSRPADESWTVAGELIGFQDKTGRNFPDVPNRISQALSSEKSRFLVRLSETPRKGTFVDGVPVEVKDDWKKVYRFSVEIVSGGLLLMTADKESRGSDDGLAPMSFTCPLPLGSNLKLLRRSPQDNVNLRRQIDDLRKGRFLAAPQDVLARVVTTPDQLQGQFQPARDVDALLELVRSRKRNPVPLNKEQKKAVSQAARTPTAFFIKGPPGTGKTQVISELIELLAARGERILLSSAQNKPLAEAVERVADSYGVAAARLTNAQRLGLNDAERITAWDALIDRVESGLRSGGCPETELTERERLLRTEWRKATGLDDAESRESAIGDLVEACLAEINLYAINVNAIASRLRPRPTLDRRPQPDFVTPFDTLIIDEASRVTDAEFVTAALRCRRWILVGDESQLPPFVDEDDSSYFHALCALYVFQSELWRMQRSPHDFGTFSAGTLSADDMAMLREAVERVENSWLSKPERLPFTKDKVFDIAEALLSQRALDRDADGGLAIRKENPREGERSLQKRLRTLASALSGNPRKPEAPRWNSDPYALREFEVEVVRYAEAQLQNLQEAFSTFVMRSFFQRGYGSGEGAEHDIDGQHSGFRTTLLQQYRMRPEIADLVSASVYNGRYTSALTPDGESRVAPLVLPTFPDPVHFVDLSLLGDLANCTQIGTGWANAAEAEHVVAVMRSIGRELPRGESVSMLVLSAYKKQIQHIKERVTEAFSLDEAAPLPPGLSELEIVSIDGAQGVEADIVIVSFVRVASDGLPEPKFAMFLQDMRRLNVAVTRAKRKVIFIGHATTIENLCGEAKSASFLASLLSPGGGVTRSLPYRLPPDDLRYAKARLDQQAKHDVDLDGPLEGDLH